MRPLFTARAYIPLRDALVRYRGSTGALDENLIGQVFSDLAVVKPLCNWLPSGGVLRDKDKACSWAKWYCGYLHRHLSDSHRDNFRHVLLLLSDNKRGSLNMLSRLEPMNGEGSICFSASVTRTADDEYACFEY